MSEWLTNQWNAFFGIEDDNASSSESSVSTDTGSVSAESVDTQAAQRRLARLSRYFTSSSGVLGSSNTGSTGVF